MSKKTLIIAPLVLAASAIATDYALLRYEKKPVYRGFIEAQFSGAPNVFEQSRLEQIAQGKDISPGLPEEGAMCAKHVRAAANSLIGSEFFMHHRLTSKIVTNLLGIETLPADKLGFAGDAWEMYFNLQKAGGKVVYNTQNPVEERGKSDEFLNNNAKIGDVVGFYYPDSQYNEIARKSGAGFTHMGIVVGLEKGTNSPIIAHLFHSQNYYENQPAARYDTMESINKKLLFEGYRMPLDFQKSSSEHQYSNGEPLIFIKSIVRPEYNKPN